MTLKQFQEVLKTEIEYSKTSALPDGITEEYAKGFIKGLEQALWFAELKETLYGDK